jgi:hypothetical protein
MEHNWGLYQIVITSLLYIYINKSANICMIQVIKYSYNYKL